MEYALYAENQPIKFTYRCNGDPATSNPVVRVIDNTGTVASTLSVGSGLTQALATEDSSLFEGSFTPTAQGNWKIHGLDDFDGDQVRDFAVGLHGLQWLIDKTIEMDGQIDTIEVSVGGISVVDGKIDQALTDIATLIAAQVTTDGKVDTVLADIADVKLDVAGVQTTSNSIESKIDNLAQATGGAHFG